MKFGLLLDLWKTEGPEEFRPYYLRYDELKAVIKVLPRHESSQEQLSVQTAMNRRLTPSDVRDELALASGSEERFVRLVEEDLERISRFVALQSESLHMRLVQLLHLCSETTVSHSIDQLRENADVLGTATCDLDKFILLNYQGFLKIAKKHDKWIGLTTRPWMIIRLCTASFFHERFDKIIAGLSDAYSLLRIREEPPDSKSLWVPPAEFSRNTTKYWVKPEDVMWLKADMIKSLPVLIFGRSKPSAGGGVGQPSSDSSLISSVYLDNGTFDVYHTRMDRLDGATLIRVRWYGAWSGPNQIVFVERKMHRSKVKKDKEEKTKEEEDRAAGLDVTPPPPALPSVKERFQVQYKDVSDLLAGKLDLKARVEGPMRVDGASDSDIAYAMQLADAVQTEIQERRLVPTMTTIYYRTSFQLSSSNAVRATLDCQLRMVDETATAKSLAPGEWYRPPEKDALKQMHEFPYAVLEVKVQGDTPDWLTALVDSGRLLKCYKFSKFHHGIAALGQPIQKAPHWFGDDRVFILPEPSASSAALSSHTLPTSSPCRLSLTAASSLSTLAAPSEPHRGGTGSPGIPVTADAGSATSQPAPAAQARSASSGRGGNDRTTSGAGSTGTGGESVAEDHVRVSVNGAQDGAPIAAGYQMGSKPGKPPKEEKGGRFFKVDPKTLFANERTMLQWLNMAVLLVFTSLALLATSSTLQNSADASGNTKEIAGGAQLCGAILAPAAVLVMIYAMWRYYWRISRITSPDKEARFEDTIGPLFLVGMIIIVCSVAILISINRFSWSHFLKPATSPPVSPATVALPGKAAAAEAQPQENNSVMLASNSSDTFAPAGVGASFGIGKTSVIMAQTGGAGTYGLSFDGAFIFWVAILALIMFIIVVAGQCQIVIYLGRLCNSLGGGHSKHGEAEPLVGASGHVGGSDGTSMTDATDYGAAQSAQLRAQPRTSKFQGRRKKWLVMNMNPPSAMVRLRSTRAFL